MIWGHVCEGWNIQYVLLKLLEDTHNTQARNAHNIDSLKLYVLARHKIIDCVRFIDGTLTHILPPSFSKISCEEITGVIKDGSLPSNKIPLNHKCDIK